ncbi:hypothetical protein [Pseudomonas protegens]|nr:hypothetical protein [Pseudomonas protegens]
MHDRPSFAVPLPPQAIKRNAITARPLWLASTRTLMTTLAALGLCGCVGAWVDMPEEQVTKTAAHQTLIGNSMTPVITRTQKSTAERQWCGTTVWAVILPIPLKLPVCESYSATSYGNDIGGIEAPLLYSSHKISSEFYACGPFMFLGPIMHGYQGNAVWGVFR